MSRNTAQQYWYSLTTLVYALVVVVGSYWHYCGQIACDDPSFHPTKSFLVVFSDDLSNPKASNQDSSSFKEQVDCIACLLSELRQIDSSDNYELQTISFDAHSNVPSRLFVVFKTPNPITARGPPQLMIS